MAVRPDDALTSDTLSGFARTNPVVVRRVLGALKSNGIVLSEKGHAGGWKLGPPANTITIAGIYLALGDRFLRLPLPVRTTRLNVILKKSSLFKLMTR